ncbi:XrtA system polysaccharide deacetylase [Sphingomonas sp. LaA6.9]|uniref:XrtA system polysaccharide deacetylase n=1 Tax=Sphingomonas sp. LaA6.9 TaxID=2919914 RepID=UPI001F4F4366|nr:XrtA system polysaccharide deacetylase [Sphingomonas sp. LaA6.9]MCJ8157327.1 DUF3473 domain-containing protein [Sphingomonas sp. LaA6.9]
MLNALSVDIEDWFQVGAFENTIDRGDWDSLVPRVERNTEAVLELFDRKGVKATFFTLGWVAERYPKLIRRIVAEGHEIASHGWDHLRVFMMTPEQFRADIGRTRKTLEDVSGRPVIGYRAPSFSIDPRTPWAHPILAEQGYAYSSSVAPVRHDHYGWPDAPRFTFRPVAGSALIEIPVTTARLGARNLPTGGGFFRLLPYRYSRWAYARANRDDARPAVLYFHPWDIDPGQPRVGNAPLRSKLRHYTFLARMEGKLERLLGEFKWGRMDDVAALEARRTR